MDGSSICEIAKARARSKNAGENVAVWFKAKRLHLFEQSECLFVSSLAGTARNLDDPTAEI